MKKKTGIFYFLLLAVGPLRGQELEPRLYAALPKNLNAIGVAYGISHGNVLTDPSLPVSGFKITAHNVSAAYVRTFGIAKKLARVQLSVPYLYMSGKLQINGRDTSASRSGLGDARLRFSINLLGTPAYDKREFAKYSQSTVLGLGIVTSVPTGMYDETRRINIGSNRWGFKPEIGISRRFNRLYGELYSGVWFYTDNTRFVPGKRTLEQEPLFSLQAHISYYFKNQMGLSASGTWFEGGRTLVNDVPTGETLDNWRVGGTWSIPLKKGHALKLQFHTGAFTTRGYDYDIVLLAYQYVFF